MGPFVLTLFISCGHTLYISVQSVLNILEHVKEIKKGIGVVGGEWDFALVWNPIKKIHLGSKK
jgi:hypothetical protein